MEKQRKAADQVGDTEDDLRAVTLGLVGALGEDVLAELLGVNKDKPGRWVSGQAAPDEADRAQLEGVSPWSGTCTQRSPRPRQDFGWRATTPS